MEHVGISYTRSVDFIACLGASVFDIALGLRTSATPSQAAETGRSMKYTGKPVMKSALWAYESAAGGFSSIRPPRVAAHEIPPDGGTKAAHCAACSAFTGVKAEGVKEKTGCPFGDPAFSL